MRLQRAVLMRLPCASRALTCAVAALLLRHRPHGVSSHSPNPPEKISHPVEAATVAGAGAAGAAGAAQEVEEEGEESET